MVAEVVSLLLASSALPLRNGESSTYRSITMNHVHLIIPNHTLSHQGTADNMFIRYFATALIIAGSALAADGMYIVHPQEVINSPI